MIKVDLSNLVPKRLGAYLLGIIPGLLFGMSLALGDPELARRMIDRARQIYPFPPYGLVGLFTGSCFVIGETLLLLSWFAALLITLAYWFRRYFVRVTFGSDWLYRLLGLVQGMPPKRNIAIRALSRIIFWARKKRFAFEIRPVLVCQRAAATQLLIRRYGISPRTGPSSSADLEWQVWLSVLGKPLESVRESFLAMRTFLACGLAELSALYVSPALRNRYFVAISVTFIAFGCVQSWSFAKLKYEPVRSSLTRLASLMAELSEAKTATKEEERGPEKSTIAINTETEGDAS
jgi:hypothetical protein